MTNVTQKPSLRSLRAAMWRSMKLVISVSPMIVFLVMIFRIISAFIPSLQVLIVKDATDAIAALLTENGSMRTVVFWLGLGAALAAFGVLLESLNQYVTLLLRQKAQYKMETMLAEKALGIPLTRFEQPQYYDQLQRAKSNVTFRAFQLIEQIFRIGQSVLTVISMFIVLWQFSWLLSVGMILFLFPTLFVHMRIGEWKYILQRFQTPFSRRLFYFFDLLTNRASAKELRLYRHEKKLLEYWSGFYWKNANEQKRVELKTLGMRSGVEGVNGLLGFLFSCYAVWICYSNRLSLGTYVAIAQVLSTTQSTLRTIAQGLSSIYEESLVMTEFFTFIETPEEEEQGRDRIRWDGMLKEGITVENLTFAYPSNPRPVLKNISFTVKPRQKIAIVGENGAGKSTLVNCLIGLYREYTGAIRYDGVEIREFDIASLRSKISAVFQDFLRYQVPVKENIGFGDVGRLDDVAAIEAAAARSGASEVIRTLPEGMDTLLGPVFEGGQELSVGQWQKLALARSFMRDSAIIVLDEPTASMDPMAEAELFQRFAELAEGRTTFLISHRLGSCRMADHILVMKNGELIEQGSHEELMQLKGEYHRMFEMQSVAYR